MKDASYTESHSDSPNSEGSNSNNSVFSERETDNSDTEKSMKSYVSYSSSGSEELEFSDSSSYSGGPMLSYSEDSESINSEFSDTEVETLTESNTCQLTNELAALKIVSCFRRHNLTASASKDITETMKSIFSDSDQANILNFEYLMSFIEKYPLKEVHYCEICTEVFPEDPDEFQCRTENCEGYRYKGPLSKQTKKDRQPRKFYIFTDIRRQLSDLLLSPGNTQTKLSGGVYWFQSVVYLLSID